MAATQEASSSPAPSAQVVGNAFVGQYYHILHHSPQSVHRFYQDSSLLSRPDVNGVMTTVTGMQAINDKIISLNYGDYTAEIITADAQESHEKGVIVLVTGCLTGKDNLRRKFSQTFFLAPQDKGYYVLNDVLRHVEETESNRSNSSSGDAIKENTTTVTSTPEPEPSHAPNHLTVEPPISLEEEDMNNDPEVCDPSSNDEGSVVEQEEVPEPPQQIEHEVVVTADAAPVAQEDAPKKSYASIVKVPKSISGPVYVATTPVRAAPPANPDHQSIGLAKPAPVPDASAVNGDNLPESSNLHEEAEGHSIYVRNLPFDATVEQLEEEFKKFGPIKRDGIQVRSNKQGFCFGFVEFEQLSSVHGALEASPVTIGDRQAVVEEKRTTTRVSGSGRGGRFPTGRGGGFRSDSFRARGNYGGGRGYGRNDFRNQGEFAGRARGSTGRNGDGYQRANQNGGGRGGGRQGGVNRSAVSG
ncbi:ras GTPase-activating protein-binding protein 2-like [Cucurbita moschata]|uniref:Ras GTPase-activating protein-binding protein 2-like n=1 Tax=Cucurbita moschata TaxID=3662 RepID=A0A6J1EZW4_CUCMO|nr:ras GTPase-activating protein-binding protein 2-like [Cucurbita moschata]